MRLDNHVQTTSTHKTASLVVSISNLPQRRRAAYYARGKDIRNEDITSAMQMVADRDTPTRQWTRVAVPSSFPCAVKFYLALNSWVWNRSNPTDKLQTSLKETHQRVDSVILYAVDQEYVLGSPALLLRFGPVDRFSDTQDLFDPQSL